MAKCPLHGSDCDHYIPWSGPTDARLAIIGEGPGAQELLKGEPFVGPAGAKLNEVLKQVGLERDRIFVYNAVPCFNSDVPRTPTDGDIKRCRPHLFEVLAKNRPDVIVAAGASALFALTGRKGIKQLQGVEMQVHVSDGYEPWVVPVYHPAYILRTGDPIPLSNGLAKAKRQLESVSAPDWMPGYILVDDSFLRHEAVEDLTAAGAWAFDVESAKSEIIMVGVGVPGHKPYVFPLQAYGEMYAGNREAIRRIFSGPTPIRIAHNGKYDVRALKREGLMQPTDRGMTWDTMLAAHLLDESRADRGALKLKAMGLELFGVVAYWKRQVGGAALDTLLREGRALEAPLDALADYNARDVALTLRLYDKLRPELEGDSQLNRLFHRLVIPVSWAMERMERVGLPVDTEKIAELVTQYEKDRDEATERLNSQMPGQTINWNSPKQVQVVLFEPRDKGGLGLPVIRRTEPSNRFPQGQPSTDDDTLVLLRGQHPLIDDLQALRKAKKLAETAISLKEAVDPGDGRIHPTFVVAGPATGRTSSRDPNMQNLQRGPGIRDIIRAGEGRVLVEVDLGLAEMRWGAYVYKEATMARLLTRGEDLHRYTASLAFGRPPEEVTDAERHLGKTANFLCLYGGGANKLATELRSKGMSRNEAVRALVTMGRLADVPDPIQNLAVDLHKAFHRAYPGVGKAHANIRQMIARDKRVRSVFGRIRNLPGIDSMFSYAERENAARQGSNTLVQGPASDTLLFGLEKLINGGVIDAYGAEIIDAVHDSILAEVPEEKAREFAGVAQEVLKHPPLAEFGLTDFTIPIESDSKIGKSWGSMEKISGVQEPEESFTNGQGGIPERDPADIANRVYPSAALYVSKGWSVIPLTSSKTGQGHDTSVGKTPVLPTWREYQTRRPTDVELTAWFGPKAGAESPYNIAIVTGQISKLVVVDIDPRNGGDKWLTETKLDSPVKVRSGGGGLHLYFRHDGVLKSTKLMRDGKTIGVDVQAEGKYVVAPPSLHMSGERYRWMTEDGLNPFALEVPPLPAWLLTHIETNKLSDDITVEAASGDRVIPDDKIESIVDFVLPYYTEGNRHELQLALAGFLAKRNYRLDDAERVVRLLMERSGDSEVEDRIRALRDSFDVAESGKPTTGSGKLVDLIGTEEVERLQNLFGSAHASGTTRVFSALDVQHMDIKKEDWLVEGLLPRGGFAMLSGHPGSGKSTFIIQAGLEMAAGKHVFGNFFVPRPLRVLYFQADNPPSMIRRLLQSMLRRGKVAADAASRFLIAEVMQPMTLSTEEGYSILEQHVKLYNPDLLIFDTIRDFHSADENNPTAVAETIGALKRLRGDSNLSILYLHHHSKSFPGQERNQIERHMGSMRFVTPVDLAMSLTFFQEDETKVKLTYTKVRWAAKPGPRLFRRDNDWYVDEGEVPTV